MKYRSRRAVALAALLMVSACGGPPADSAAEDETSAPASGSAAVAAAPEAAGPPAIFGQCRSCHAIEAGKNGVGPSLAGIVGRKAGSVAGYGYTPANRDSGLTWDEATLDEYLTAPAKKIPGTKMIYAGITDAAKRQELIAYLKTLK